MINSGAKCGDVIRVSPAGKTTSYQTGRANNIMEPPVNSVQQTKVEICPYLTCRNFHIALEALNTDVQQLKAEIAALVTYLCDTLDSGDENKVVYAIAKLRQLSAV